MFFDPELLVLKYTLFVFKFCVARPFASLKNSASLFFKASLFESGFGLMRPAGLSFARLDGRQAFRRLIPSEDASVRLSFFQNFRLKFVA